MRRWMLLGVVVATSLACGGMMEGMDMPAVDGGGGGAEAAPKSGGGGGAKGDNVTACKAYVEKMNSCLPDAAKQDASQTCPDALNMMPCDAPAKYYQCMADAIKCGEYGPDLTGIQACGTMGTCM
ncbi:MAG: hypothetical protein H6738_02190 [Alphaproteobacteria bacterium]|nr:hypothetical protein [Alphaproteobacteria bacterium]MCB9695579.1 hypothetical protein [Alphaproteobacteria bacterium]